jgi:hypothetical protein
MMRNVVLATLFIAFVSALYAQDRQLGSGPVPTTDSLNKALAQFRGGKYLDQVDRQASALNNQLTSQSAKYLQAAASEENQLKNRLQKIDSGAAGSLFGNVSERYGQLQSALVKGTPTGILGHAPASYLPSLDSMKNTLLFLRANQDKLTGLTSVQAQKLSSAVANVQALESKLQAVENLKTVLQQRQQYLTQQLGKFGMAGQLGQMNQTVYYYKQQISDLKASLQDPSKMQQKAMAVLSQLPAYRSFLAKNSFMGRMFGQPENYNLTDSSMKGLQTRAAVQKEIQQKTGVGGPGASQQVSQQVQQATSMMTSLQSKLLQGGNGPDPNDLGFTPNSQKTKSLWKRLEYGANLQFEPATTLLPTLCDAALSLGYRLNDKATVGVGGGLKLGLGNGLQHIAFSGQGASIRSYIDWKMKKNLYLTGGYEENYLSAFQNLDQLRSVTGWQKSGLIGITRQYQISGKVKAKAQLLFDFLSFSQIPKAQPVIFRVGWSL